MAKPVSGLTELEARKKQLEQEIQGLQDEMAGTVGGVRQNFDEKRDPKYWIKKYPLTTAVGSVIAGVLVGSVLRSGGGSASENKAPEPSPALSAGSSMANELKKMLFKKAGEWAASYFEEQVEKWRAKQG